MKIWAFDLGVTSIGYAIRNKSETLAPFADVQSLLIPEDYGSTADAAARRRAYRTRLAHKAREAWLRKVFREAGMGDAVLEGRVVERKGNGWELSRRGDYRLEREFPPARGTTPKDGAPADEKGAATVYCGALLRALLIAGPEAQRAIQGRELEPWQVFKALHSAIQKRGYDPDLPWKRTNESTKKKGKKEEVEEEKDDKEEGEIRAAASAMQGLLENLPDGCRHPCYWECRQMGLWSENAPSQFHLKQTHHAEATTHRVVQDPAGGYREERAVFLRRSVEAEVMELCARAEQLLPALEGRGKYILYGPAEEAYASYKAAHASPTAREEMYKRAGGKLVPGKASDWQGVLSQKIPTFENRIPSACLLIPRLHATKTKVRAVNGRVAEESLLAAEYVFLKQLKNLRFAIPNSSRAFTPAEIRSIFGARRKAILQGAVENDAAASKLVVSSFRLAKRDLGKEIHAVGGVALLPNQEEIEAPRLTGRSVYSRPALRMLRALLLSGLPPREFKRRLLAREGDVFAQLAEAIHLGNDGKRGLVASDLEVFDRMGETWEGFYIADARLDSASKAAESGDKALREGLVRELIGGVLDPVVRHRLDTFYRLLKRLEAKHGAPDRIAIEFVRDQFMRGDSATAKKRRDEYWRSIKRRTEERVNARAQLQGQSSGNDILKVQLWNEQGSACIFCGKTIGNPSTVMARDTLPFNLAQIAHIVPDKAGGPRAYLNLTVACHNCNAQQRERYHADWFRQDGLDWGAFAARMNGMTKMAPFKKKLLTCGDAAEAAGMVERRTALQQTAWISKLSQSVACLHFGWPLNFAGDNRRILVVPGAITNQTARRSGLYRLLGSEEMRAANDAELKALRAAAEAEHQSPEDRIDAWRAFYARQEEVEKKFRDDKRHHALDAMVLSFIPTWATDPTNKYWRGLPKEADFHFFARELEKVTPRAIATEAPRLEDSIYRARQGRAVLRYNLKDLGYKGRNPKYELKAAADNAESIVDAAIRARVLDFVKTDPDEAQWVAFCATFRLTSDGPFIRRVACSVSPDLKEYKDLSKDQSGAYRRAQKSQGYYVVLDEKKNPEVVPIYAHESPIKVQQNLAERKNITVYGYFTSGCRVQIFHEIKQRKTILPPGAYILRTLSTAGRAKLEMATGVIFRGIGIAYLVQAGLARMD